MPERMDETEAMLRRRFGGERYTLEEGDDEDMERTVMLRDSRRRLRAAVEAWRKGGAVGQGNTDA